MTERKRPPTKGDFKTGFDPRRCLTGRPKKGETLAEKIRAAFSEEVIEGYTKLDALIDEAMEQAKAGNYQMMEMLWSRAYGKVPDKLEVKKDEPIDLSKLSDEELETLERLQKKAHGETA